VDWIVVGHLVGQTDGASRASADLASVRRHARELSQRSSGSHTSGIHADRRGSARADKQAIADTDVRGDPARIAFAKPSLA
jgi:hypothetical protein